jgi:hypothetical protein
VNDQNYKHNLSLTRCMGEKWTRKGQGEGGRDRDKSSSSSSSSSREMPTGKWGRMNANKERCPYRYKRTHLSSHARSLTQGKLTFAMDSPLESSLATWQENALAEDDDLSPTFHPHSMSASAPDFGGTRQGRRVGERGRMMSFQRGARAPSGHGLGGLEENVRVETDMETPRMTTRPFSVDLSKSL